MMKALEGHFFENFFLEVLKARIYIAIPDSKR